MTKNKQTIAIDVDDTLAEFAPAFIDFHDKKYHSKIDISKITSYNSFFNLDCTGEEFVEKVYEFYESGMFSEIEPVKGSISAINHLSKHFNLIVITSRPTETQEKTCHWLDKHFSNVFSEIVLTNQFSKTSATTTKAQVCQSQNAKYFIDDAIEYASSCSQFSKVFLLNQPWNQTNFLPSNTSRVFNWEEIVESLLN